MRGDETILVPEAGFILAYAITRNFDLDGLINYLWQEPGSAEKNAARHALLGVNWSVDQHGRVSLGGRWDGDVLKEDYAKRVY
jgi:hypothetical protein